MTAPASTTCVVCGRYPARVFSIRRHVGLIVMQQFIKARQSFCREHASQLAVSYTLKTLWQGWWGYISFFVNWFVLAANVLVMYQASRMPAPVALQQPTVAPPVAAWPPPAGVSAATPPPAPSHHVPYF